MLRILIAGCGKLGNVLGRQLADEGHAVWGLRRSADRIAPPLQALSADLCDANSLKDLPWRLDFVVYAAAASAYDDAAYAAAYVDGVRTLLNALYQADQPVRRFLMVSSTSVYGQHDGEWVDEESPTEPGGFGGQRLLQGEQAVLTGPFPGMVVRFAGIYGPGRNRLIERARQGTGCVAEPARYTNRIHIDDCAGVLAHLMRVPQPASVYLGVDDAPVSECEVMDWLAVQLGVAAPPRFKADDVNSGRGGNKRCRNTRLLESGYRFTYPSYREGYAAMLRAYSGEAGETNNK